MGYNGDILDEISGELKIAYYNYHESSRMNPYISSRCGNVNIFTNARRLKSGLFLQNGNYDK